MSRKSPSILQLRRLYAISGNICAFPKCEHPIFNDSGLYIAQLCHIEAASPGGPRYNKNQSEKERNSESNLLFMCHRHHKETDDIKVYTVEKLRDIKQKHESTYTEAGRGATLKMLQQINDEIEIFWSIQEKKVFKYEEFKMRVNVRTDIKKLFREVEKKINHIESHCEHFQKTDSDDTLRNDLELLLKNSSLSVDDIFSKLPYWENPFINRNWELHHLGSPNILTQLELSFYHLKVKVYEVMVSNDPDNLGIRLELIKARKKFEKLYKNSYYVD